MITPFKLARLLGLSTLLRMRQAKKVAWEEMLAPHFMVRTLQTLMNVGLIDEMRQGPVDLDDFARRKSLDPRLLRALCESLDARKVLQKNGRGYKLGEKGEIIANTNLARGWFDLVHGYEEVLFRMEDLVRQRAVYGRDVQREGRFVGVGSGLVSVDFIFPIVCQILAATGARRILDIGCGDGAFLRHVCRALPGVQGVGVDLSPAAIEAGRQANQATGFNDTIQMHVGNALSLDALGSSLSGVTAATSFFVIHELCDGQENPLARQFLQCFRSTLPGASLHLIEPVRPSLEEMRQRPGPAIEYFLFHDLSDQKPLPREGWKELFLASGFSSFQEEYVSLSRTSIYSLHRE